MAKAVFGGGCFWCLDAVFRRVRGVKDVVVGYAGGRRPNPTYEQVCTGVTGHAEVVMIDYDENEITYDKLLDIFFDIHDPTQLNRQGNDVGTQYRSIILYLNDEQKEKALKKIEELKNKGINVVTEVKPLEKFYEAEEYHQNYFAKNPNQPYCAYVVAHKVMKFLEKYGN
ncbi:peptide-methionine (S)-S-oxide reductase MsrA [Caminibacter pacificus]|uniref:Peptide methionine sulfoxide reductase MsrA n=1 Tax=Caminibacter pacificus TaxID=1424653 RepID=A0AAJ4UXL6_9BACT|nr:peptide-methionine (S)-S-oxide reductase MsrA [Caminibacter pacificus]QCI28001.1 peptide-methionine (S)-S-oxide reductase MsrA [Caminibacter pacificus]ROR39813.1 peptide-methionine (S)-S-oxide reductase [Caminibacter pacificus]